MKSVKREECIKIASDVLAGWRKQKTQKKKKVEKN